MLFEAIFEWGDKIGWIWPFLNIVRWSVNGDLASYKIKAQSIWAEAKKDVQIQIGNNNWDLLCWGESPQWVNACNPPPSPPIKDIA